MAEAMAEVVMVAVATDQMTTCVVRSGRGRVEA